MPGFGTAAANDLATRDAGFEMPPYDLARGLARETLCRLLAACHYQPAVEFAEENVFDALEDAAGRVDSAFIEPARALGSEFARSGPDALLIDYTRLFIGPAQIVAKPYESVWLDVQESTMGNSTLEVLDIYRDGGFEIDDAFRDLPDHIAVELEFLYLLIFRENQAHRRGDLAELRAVDDLKRRFLHGHLGRWVGPFANAVRAGAETDFYRHLAELTARFVSVEAGDGVAR